MTEEIQLTRRQLEPYGANHDWFDTHMRGRGKLPLSKVVTCAPVYFSVIRYNQHYTGAVVYADGARKWYRNGLCHRDDGPAVEFPTGRREWWRNGRLHRDDGPAVERADGQQVWFRDGRRYASEQAWRDDT